jgi:hypothetical protein
MMAALDFTRRRPLERLPSRAIDIQKAVRGSEAGVEVGRTVLILMLIAAGIVALRYVLDLAYGLLH